METQPYKLAVSDFFLIIHTDYLISVLEMESHFDLIIFDADIFSKN